MRALLVLVVVVVVFALPACSKDSERADEMVASMARKDVEELKVAVASPDPDSAMLNCAHMANIDMLEKADKALAAELRQLCTKDLYLAMMKIEVAKAEAERKVRPDPDAMIAACYSVMFELSKDEMTKAKTIDLAKDLIARFEAACPPKK